MVKFGQYSLWRAREGGQTSWKSRRSSIPGSIAPTTFRGSARMMGKMKGNCFMVCPAAAVAFMVSTHTGEKSGLSKWFQLRFSAYNVTTSVVRHIYTWRMGIGWPDSWNSLIRLHSFSTMNVSIGCSRSTDRFERKGLIAARRTRCNLWSSVPKPEPGRSNWLR